MNYFHVDWVNILLWDERGKGFTVFIYCYFPLISSNLQNLRARLFVGNEHVMARLLTFKHLPPSLENSNINSQRNYTAGEELHNCSQSGETHIQKYRAFYINRLNLTCSSVYTTYMYVIISNRLYNIAEAVWTSCKRKTNMTKRQCHTLCNTVLLVWGLFSLPK